MEHPAIAPAGMRPARGFFFDQDNVSTRLTSAEVASDAQPDHAAGDDNEVARGMCSSLSCVLRAIAFRLMRIS